MKIIEFYAENVKRIKAIRISPASNTVLLTGANAQGKSSVLDAIYMALAGKDAIPGKPVRDGEEKAIIRLNLGEIIVTRKFTANGGTSLVVEAGNGAKFPSPQKMLDEMLGTLTFDPLEFTRMSALKQLETLQAIVGLDLLVAGLDMDTKRLYEERTAVNREAKSLQARLDGIGLVPAETPKELVDVSGLMKQVDNCNRMNASLTTSRAKIDQLRMDVKVKQDAAKRLLFEAAELETSLIELQNTVEGLVPVDTTDLITQIESSEIVNQAVYKLNEYKKVALELSSKTQEAMMLTSRLDKIAERKAESLAAVDFPVEGLSLGDSEVLFNGVPLSQASSAEQLKISVSIAMSANPKLRILRIKDGSLLDNASLSMLDFMADLNDFQLWIEKVDESGTLGIVIEDGEIKK